MFHEYPNPPAPALNSDWLRAAGVRINTVYLWSVGLGASVMPSVSTRTISRHWNRNLRRELKVGGTEGCPRVEEEGQGMGKGLHVQYLTKAA